MQSVSTTVTQTNINSSISPSDLIDLELDDSVPQELSSESLEKINENDNTNGLLYTLDEVQELVATYFFCHLNMDLVTIGKYDIYISTLVRKS